MCKIICWNVNSINARLEHLGLLIKTENPDILLLQEIKCEEVNFPKIFFQDFGYNVAIFGQKSYNGVAVLSKNQIEDIKKGFNGLNEARYIEAITYFNNKALKVASIYVPNGNPNGIEAKQNINPQEGERFRIKLNFLEDLYNKLKDDLKNNDHFILGGDINVAPEDIDVYSVKNWQGKICFLPQEKQRFKAILNLGYADAIRTLAKEAQVFSWYDYKTRGFETGRGLRIDHFLTNPITTDILKSYKMLDYYRGLSKPSDHVPIQILLDI